MCWRLRSVGFARGCVPLWTSRLLLYSYIPARKLDDVRANGDNSTRVLRVIAAPSGREHGGRFVAIVLIAPLPVCSFKARMTESRTRPLCCASVRTDSPIEVCPSRTRDTYAGTRIQAFVTRRLSVAVVVGQQRPSAHLFIRPSIHPSVPLSIHLSNPKPAATKVDRRRRQTSEGPSAQPAKELKPVPFGSDPRWFPLGR